MAMPKRKEKREDVRELRVQFAVNDAEKKRLEEAAWRKRMTMSQYIRLTLGLEKKP